MCRIAVAILLAAPRESPEVQEIIALSCPSGRKSRWELRNPRQFVLYTSLWNEKASYEIRGTSGLRKINVIHVEKVGDLLKHH